MSIFRYKDKLDLTEKTEEGSEDITHVLFKNAIQVNYWLFYYYYLFIYYENLKLMKNYL